MNFENPISSSKEEVKVSKDELFDHFDNKDFKGFVAALEGAENISGDTVKKMVENRLFVLIGDNLEKMSQLDGGLAINLIEAGYGLKVANNLERFKNVSYEKIANSLINNRQGHILVYNIEKFPGLDRNDIAKKVIEDGMGYMIIQDIEKFQDLDKEVYELLYRPTEKA
jgi:hypothetical protein